MDIESTLNITCKLPIKRDGPFHHRHETDLASDLNQVVPASLQTAKRGNPITSFYAA
jgi:hypothetical protein